MIQHKIGALYKQLFRLYYDTKLVGFRKNLNHTAKPVKSGFTYIQSIDYVLLIESLKYFPLTSGDNVVDVGSGWGRLCLYLQRQYTGLTLTGYEVDEKAYHFSKDFNGITFIHQDIMNNISQLNANKIILFNPFNGEYFQKFLLALNTSQKINLIYINAYEEHIQAAKKMNHLTHQVIHLNVAYKGIDHKQILLLSNHNE